MNTRNRTLKLCVIVGAVVLFIGNCSHPSPQPDKSKISNQSDSPGQLYDERLGESMWWLDSDSIEATDKGYKLELGGKRTVENSKNLTQTATATSISSPSNQDPESDNLLSNSEKETSYLSAHAPIAIVANSSLKMTADLKGIIESEKEWMPRFIVSNTKLNKQKEAEILAKTISRKEHLRLIAIITSEKESGIYCIFIDGYSGIPLFIGHWSDTPTADVMKKYIMQTADKLNEKLFWSSWVIAIQDRMAIIVDAPGLNIGDPITIRNVGTGIRDPNTGLQITWTPGEIFAAGTITEKLENGYCKIQIDTRVSSSSADLVAVKSK